MLELTAVVERAPSMRKPGPLGFSIASRDFADEAIVRLGRAAEEAGFSSVFVAERVADAYILCQQLIGATSNVVVGTAITNARLRHPVAAAMTAMALARQSDGRFVAGLGMANRLLNEGRLGLPKVEPLLWLSEYVEVFRAICNGLPVSFGGTYFQIEGLDVDVVPVSVPVHLAALGPQMIELAGRIADGVILNLCPLDGVALVLDRLRRASEGRKDGVGELAISCVLPCCVSIDHRAARAAARAVIVDYVTHPSASKIFESASSPSVVTSIQAALKSGNREMAIERVPQALADQFVITGSPSQCAERLQAYSEAGIETPIVFPRPVADDWLDAVMAIPREFYGESSARLDTSPSSSATSQPFSTASVAT